MRAGRLRHRLTLQQQSETRSATGAFTKSWTTVATVWGAVEALSGSEAMVAGQMNPQTQYRVIIRYGSTWRDINSSWRIVNAGVSPQEKYDIFSVIKPQHRSRPKTVIEMLCFDSKRDDE